MLQETKQMSNQRGLTQHLKMCTVMTMPAIEGPRGGPSGGLAWLVPQNLGFDNIRAPVTVVDGLLGVLHLSYLGLPLALINVYAPPDDRRQGTIGALKRLMDQQDFGDAIPLKAGDLNIDPHRKEDAGAWAEVSQIMARHGQVPLLKGTKTHCSTEGRFTNIDHAFAPNVIENQVSLRHRGDTLSLPDPRKHAIVSINTYLQNTKASVKEGRQVV